MTNKIRKATLKKVQPNKSSDNLTWFLMGLFYGLVRPMKKKD